MYVYKYYNTYQVSFVWTMGEPLINKRRRTQSIAEIAYLASWAEHSWSKNNRNLCNIIAKVYYNFKGF